MSCPHPSGEGRGGWGRGRTSEIAGVVSRVHIPQERVGDARRVDVQGWDVVRAKVVVVG